MNVEFWYDPACPWCWRTSRWLVDVAPHRDLTVEWTPISLLLKNGGPDAVSERYRDSLIASHGLLRVGEKLRRSVPDGSAAVGRFYTEIGTAIHHDSVKPQDINVRAVLHALRYPEEIAEAAQDDAEDAAIAAAMERGLSQTGNDVGTPIIAFEGAGAYFGPVIDPVPEGEAALALFDAVVNLARVPGMWELKRSRDGAPGPMPRRPDTVLGVAAAAR